MLPHPVQQPPLPQPPLLDYQHSYGFYNSVPNSPNPLVPRVLSQASIVLPQYRAVPQLPQQRSPNQPHRTNSYPTHGPNEDAAPQHPRASEHMLRRKTPNGTLAAGYDGTPVEWGSKPHATKHILIPVSSASNTSSSINHQLPLSGVRGDPNANLYF